MKKVAFCTLGCKVNQYETNAMEKSFIEAGYEVVPFSDIADVYVINTCTVTGVGDKKSRQMIRRAKKNNEKAIVAAVGCMAQVAKDDVLKIKEADIVLGNNQKQKIVECVTRAMEEKQQISLVEDVMLDTAFEETPLDGFSGKDRAYIKIQDGCNKFCSYCIIPYARGHIRSRSIENIKKEATRLAENGFFEVTLTGIHVASYRDADGNTLADVIKVVSEISKIARIRLSSIDPLAFTDEFIEKIKDVKKLCPHFHISLQSGSDKILSYMNRRYTTAKFSETVRKLRSVFPDLSVTTDIITGFPYETDKEFRETYKFLEEIALSGMHVFPYSERKGTPAATFPEKVEKSVRDSRAKEIAGLAQKQKSAFAKRFVGRVMPILFEEGNKKDEYAGFTENYVRVFASSDKKITGKILPVKMLFEKDGELYGEIANQL